MKLQAGIRLLNEIEGNGDPIRDSDVFDAVLKFYRNKGDPLEFDTVFQDPIPYIQTLGGHTTIGWTPATMHRSNVVFERHRVLARQCDVLPGIYYTILGMKSMGYRHVAIPPHLFAHAMHEVLGIDRDSVVKVEVFLMRIQRTPAPVTACAPITEPTPKPALVESFPPGT